MSILVTPGINERPDRELIVRAAFRSSKVNICPGTFKWNGLMFYHVLTNDVMHIGIYYEGSNGFEPLAPS